MKSMSWFSTSVRRNDASASAKVTRLLDRGAVVELRDDVEGFVPVGQMAKPDLKHPEQCYGLDDVLPLKVIKIDPKSKRIVLSVSAYLKGAEDEEITAFHEKYPVREMPERAPEDTEALEGEDIAMADDETSEHQVADAPAEVADAPAEVADAPAEVAEIPAETASEPAPETEVADADLESPADDAPPEAEESEEQPEAEEDKKD
jgi:predicted RNA-binding protein with RPS1 domain